MSTVRAETDKDGQTEKSPSRKVQSIEIGIFLLLIVPSMVSSYLIPGLVVGSFTVTAIASILNDVALLGLVLYFLWRNGEVFSSIGWTLRGIRHETVLGALLFLPMFYTIGVISSLLQVAGLHIPSKPPAVFNIHGPSKLLLATLLIIIVAIAEETIFRGYLIRRFQAITSSKTAAVLLSSFVFSLGHGYEGIAGMITVFCLGVVFAVVYLWRRTLTASVTMHFVQDFTAIVLASLVGQR